MTSRPQPASPIRQPSPAARPAPSGRHRTGATPGRGSRRVRACLGAGILLGWSLLIAGPALSSQVPAAGGGGPDDLSPEVEAQLSEASIAIRRGSYEQAVTSLRQALATRPDLHAARFELARVLAFLGRFEEAAEEFAAVVAAQPENGMARRGEITALIFQGDYRAARVKLEDGLVALPRDGQLAHTLARLLASAPDDEVRDGALAAELARRVYEVRKSPATGETLAMAHAEAGDFEQAVEVQRELLGRAEASGDTAGVEQLRERLLTYLRREPWRAVSPAEIAMATEPPGGAPARP